MMPVNFDLSRLSDRILDMFLETSLSEEKKYVASPFLHTVQVALVDEQLRRLSQGAANVHLILPCMDMEEILTASLNLLDSCVALEGAAFIVEDKDPALSAEYKTGAEFCCTLGMALREHGWGLALAQSGPPN
jgi:hypothetical protein